MMDISLVRLMLNLLKKAHILDPDLIHDKMRDSACGNSPGDLTESIRKALNSTLSEQFGALAAFEFFQLLVYILL